MVLTVVLACIFFAGVSSGMDIDKAVIYDDRAVVELYGLIDGSLTLEAPADVIPESLVVRPLETGRIESVSVEPSRTLSGKAKAIKDELDRTQAALSLKKRELVSVERQVDALLASIGSGDRPAASKRQLAEILGFVDEKVRALNRTAVEIQSALPDLEIRARDLQTILERLGTKPGRLVKIEGKGPVTISYAAKTASFIPSYRIFSSPDSSRITLEYCATISQTTGMDWNIRKLVLATGRPGRGIQAPELRPWYVGQRPRLLGKAVAESLEASAPADVLPDVEPTGATSLLGAAQDILLSGDGTPVTIRIGSLTMDAAFSAVSAPKHDERAFLRAEATLSGGAPLLEGTYSSFIDGVFSGTGRLPRVEAGQKMTVDLGVLEGVLMKRTERKVFHETTLTGKDRTTYEYVINAKNTRQKEIRLIVRDQVPLSREENTVVNILKTEPDARPDSEGAITWEAALGPGVERQFTFSFSITSDEGQPWR